MASSLNGFEFGVLCVVVAFSVVPAIVIAFALVRVNLRQATLIQKLTEANLALSEKPAAFTAARLMEETERVTAQANGRIPQRKPSAAQ